VAGRRLRLTPPRVPEDSLHESVARALDILLLPPAQYTTIPAGGYGLTPAAAARLCRLGLKTGWPDLIIVYAGRIFGIELKAAGGELSHTVMRRTKRGKRIVIGQQQRHIWLREAGMQIAVCRTLDMVIAQLRAWEIPLRGAV